MNKPNVQEKPQEVEKEKHRITYKDLMLIRSHAITHHVKQSTQVKLSSKTLDQTELTHVSMVEALIMYLNSEGLLNTFVEMDYDLK